jgi:hypothetical protein
MRFEPRFGLGDLYTFSIGCLFLCVGVASWFLGSSRSLPIGEIVPAIIYILVALFLALRRYSVYWEMNSDCLRVGSFWTVREVAWVEVTHVGSFPKNSPTSDTLTVDYIRGQIVANPEDRQQFISALRRFAPESDAR